MASAKDHGSHFGDGVYTGNNPEAFSKFGDIGLLVGRLQGKVLKVKSSLTSSTKIDADVHCIIGDKLTHAKKLDSSGWPVDDFYHEVVLRSSKQCLPLIRYDASLENTKEGKEGIANMERCLVALVDRFFNEQRDEDIKPSSTATTPSQGADFPSNVISAPPKQKYLPPPKLLSGGASDVFSFIKGTKVQRQPAIAAAARQGNGHVLIQTFLFLFLTELKCQLSEQILLRRRRILPSAIQNPILP